MFYLHILDLCVLDAQCSWPGALDRIHDGQEHVRGGALASQVSSVQLENKGENTRRERRIILHCLCNMSSIR